MGKVSSGYWIHTSSFIMDYIMFHSPIAKPLNDSNETHRVVTVNLQSVLYLSVGTERVSSLRKRGSVVCSMFYAWNMQGDTRADISFGTWSA